MIGPLMAVAACRFFDIECAAAPGGRQAGQWVIGSTLGLYFTPQVAELVTRAWWLLLLAALFALALGYLSGFVLARMARVDRTTAVFASVPGGAAEMSVLGERFGARVDEVAAAQSLRMMLVVIVIPWIFAVLKLHGEDTFRPGTTEVRPLGLAALLAATLAGGLVLAAGAGGQRLCAGSAGGGDSAYGGRSQPVRRSALAYQCGAASAWLRARRALRAQLPAPRATLCRRGRGKRCRGDAAVGGVRLGRWRR